MLLPADSNAEASSPVTLQKGSALIFPALLAGGTVTATLGVASTGSARPFPCSPR